MNIRVDLNTAINDGTEVVFRSPVDCSQVTGLKVYYPDGSQEFAFADAHGNNVGDIDHLFAENVAVKVILDVTNGMAFVQNADTNAYIERTFVKTVNGATPDENGNVEVAAGGGGGGVTQDDLDQLQIELETTINQNYSEFEVRMEDAENNIARIDKEVGDIETAVDSIIAIQSQLIGGDGV